MSTELITITDTPIKRAYVHGFASAIAQGYIPEQELSVMRFCGPAKLDDPVCVQLLIRQAGSNDGECIRLTRTQAEILRDVLTDGIVNYGRKTNR